MVAARAAFFLAAVVSAACLPVASSEKPEVVEEAFAMDDACAAQGGEDCELSLRQLRAGQASAMEQNATVSKHEHAEAAPAAHAAQMRANVTAFPGCTAFDAAEMARLGGGNAQGSFPEIRSRCGSNASTWNSFDPDSMSSCLQKRAGISPSCAACFVKFGQYVIDNCKVRCRMFGSWCSRECLLCNSKGNEEAQACAGVETPRISSC